MSPNGRGTCSGCGKSVAVRYDGGALAHHAVGDLYDGDYCKGRGKPVRRSGIRTEEEAAARVQALLNELEASAVAFDVYDGEVVFGRLGVRMAATVENKWEVYEV